MHNIPIGEITERFCSPIQLVINICSKSRENLFISPYIHLYPNVIKSGSKRKHILFLALISHLATT